MTGGKKKVFGMVNGNLLTIRVSRKRIRPLETKVVTKKAAA